MSRTARLYTGITHNVSGKAFCVTILWFDSLYLNNIHLSKHVYNVVLDLFCIFPENTHEQQLIPAKILYLCPSRHILDYLYAGSQFSTGVVFPRVRHVKNEPCDIFSTHETRFSTASGSFLYDEKWPLGRLSTGVVIRRYSGTSTYSLFHTVKITDFLDFLHEFCEEKSKIFRIFKTNFVLIQNIKNIRWCAEVSKNQQKITFDRAFPVVKYWGLKYMNFLKEKAEEIWLSPMTKTLTPAEMSKGQSDNTNNAAKKNRLHSGCGPP